MAWWINLRCFENIEIVFLRCDTRKLMFVHGDVQKLVMTCKFSVNKERDEMINNGQRRAGKHVAHHCFDICLTKKLEVNKLFRRRSTKHMLAGNSGSKSKKEEIFLMQIDQRMIIIF